MGFGGIPYKKKGQIPNNYCKLDIENGSFEVQSPFIHGYICSQYFDYDDKNQVQLYTNLLKLPHQNSMLNNDEEEV